MKIVIDIPEEFENHFNSDRFEDSLARVASDIESFGFVLAGRYEQETITMLRKALKNGTPLPKGHGRLIDADKLEPRDISPEAWYSPMWGFELVDIEDAPTILKADKAESEE